MAIDPDHVKKRQALRSLGVILIVVGGGFFLIGAIDFFRSMNSFGSPKLFWMTFVGLPLFAIGMKLTAAGFLGAVTRYGAGEVAPVAKDALLYLKDPAHSSEDLVVCASCGARGRPDARFCDSCGATMGIKCQGCSTLNDAGSKFCDNCGKALVQQP